jgi:hypothetical protein
MRFLKSKQLKKSIVRGLGPKVCRTVDNEVRGFVYAN